MGRITLSRPHAKAAHERHHVAMPMVGALIEQWHVRGSEGVGRSLHRCGRTPGGLGKGSPEFQAPEGATHYRRCPRTLSIGRDNPAALDLPLAQTLIH